MSDVAILGAGELGGAVAHVLARRARAASICLIDESGRVAEGKALDIAQAGPVDGFATQLSGSTDRMATAGANIIVVADPARGGDASSNDTLLALKELGALTPAAVIVCAAPWHRDVVERAVRELNFPRRRILGSAPDALAAGARALVALECNTSPQDVALGVIGVPPDHLVVLWESGSIGGMPATALIDEPTRRRIGARIRALWPPGPYALATAAAKIVEAIDGRSRRLACCFVVSDDGEGIRTRTAALPVRLGREGVSAVMLPALNGAERVALDNAMLL